MARYTKNYIVESETRALISIAEEYFGEGDAVFNAYEDYYLADGELTLRRKDRDGEVRNRFIGDFETAEQIIVGTDDRTSPISLDKRYFSSYNLVRGKRIALTATVAGEFALQCLGVGEAKNASVHAVMTKGGKLISLEIVYEADDVVTCIRKNVEYDGAFDAPEWAVSSGGAT